MEGAIASTQIDDDSEVEDEDPVVDPEIKDEDLGSVGSVHQTKPMSVEEFRSSGAFIDVGCSDTEEEGSEPDLERHRDMTADADIEEWAASTQLLGGGLSQALEDIMNDAELTDGASADESDCGAVGAIVPFEGPTLAEGRGWLQEPVDRAAAPESTASLPDSTAKPPRSSQGWERIWSMLASLGWVIESGPRGSQSQSYFLPPGVKRGSGAKVRVHYFDSRAQVLRFLQQEFLHQGSTPAHSDTVKMPPCDEQAESPPQHVRAQDTCPTGRAAGATMSSWELLWAQLHVKGWRLETGPRGNQTQTYYMPPGVTRGPGARNRIDYFDSKAMVLRHLHSSGAATLRGPVSTPQKRPKHADPRSKNASGSKRLRTRSTAPLDGSPCRRFSSDWPGDVDESLLPKDAPEGHVAHTMIKTQMHHHHPLVSFRYGEIHFQTTLAAAGSRRAAEVIARACWLRFEAGWEKQDVLKFRCECYQRCARASAPTLPCAPVAKRPRPPAELQLLAAPDGGA